MNAAQQVVHRQEEVLRAINEGVAGGGEAGGGLGWLAAAALAMSLLLLVLRWRRSAAADRPKALHDPDRLLKELRKATGMKRSEVRALRRAADEAGRARGVRVGNPMLMVLCPSLAGKRRQA